MAKPLTLVETGACHIRFFSLRVCECVFVLTIHSCLDISFSCTPAVLQCQALGRLRGLPLATVHVKSPQDHILFLHRFAPQNHGPCKLDQGASLFALAMGLSLLSTCQRQETRRLDLTHSTYHTPSSLLLQSALTCSTYEVASRLLARTPRNKRGRKRTHRKEKKEGLSGAPSPGV